MTCILNAYVSVLLILGHGGGGQEGGRKWVGRRGDSHFCSRGGNLVLQEGGRSGGHNRKSHYKEPPKYIFLGKKIFCF